MSCPQPPASDSNSDADDSRRATDMAASATYASGGTLRRLSRTLSSLWSRETEFQRQVLDAAEHEPEAADPVALRTQPEALADLEAMTIDRFDRIETRLDALAAALETGLKAMRQMHDDRAALKADAEEWHAKLCAKRQENGVLQLKITKLREQEMRRSMRTAEVAAGLQMMWGEARLL